MRREKGFTLIELLIVIAIIGILAAIAIPNLLAAVQRGKQKRTMADMRSFATAVEAYALDNNTYPAAACPDGMLAYGSNEVTDKSNVFTALSPTYISMLPVRDGWGHSFLYNSSPADKYQIVSLARDNAPGSPVCGTTTSFNDDIIYANGAFLQWPEGVQN